MKEETLLLIDELRIENAKLKSLLKEVCETQQGRVYEMPSHVSVELRRTWFETAEELIEQ